jgi:gluconolactonase
MLLCCHLLSAGVFAPGAAPVLLSNGLATSFFEGPSWDGASNVYFSDGPNNRLYQWSDTGGMAVWMTNAAGPNGTYLSSTGDLLVCQAGLKRVARIAMDKTVTPVVSQCDGTNFNSCNDIWEAPNGAIYFTDPRWSPNGGFVYYVAPLSTQAVRLATTNVIQPNGIIGTQDGNTLYINDDAGQKVYRYTILPDGTVSGAAIFATVGRDGSTIDDQGNIYPCNWSASRINVFNEDGVQVDFVSLPYQCWNVTRYGAQLDKLFITAGSNPSRVYSMQLAPRAVYRQGIRGYRHGGAMLASALPGSNFVGLGAVQVGHNAVSGGVVRAVFQFDLTNLPAASVVTNAVLKLRALARQGTVTTLELHRLTMAFSAGTGTWAYPSADGVSWNNAASGVPWTPGGAFDPVPFARIALTGSINQTPLYVVGTALVAVVQAAVNAQQPFGFIVRSADAENAGGVNAVQLGSNNAGFQQARPMLTLDVIPEPGAVLVVCWLACLGRRRRASGNYDALRQSV